MPDHRLIHKTRYDEEELRQSLLQANLEEAQRDHANVTPHFMKLLTAIYNVYDPFFHIALPATTFQFIELMYNRSQLARAKKMLMIKSTRRRDGVWYWSFPKVTPQQAVEITQNKGTLPPIKAYRDMRMLHYTLTRTLMGIMRDSNYFISRDDVVKEMIIRGYSEKSTVRTKSRLGIITRKIQGNNMWVWAPREVHDWLENYLADGGQPVDDILSAAMHERGWNHHVMDFARRALGTIKFTMIENRGCWIDVGSATSAAATPMSDNLITPEQAKAIDPVLDRAIVVDFLDVDEADCELPDEFRISS